MYWYIYTSGTDVYVKFSGTKINSNYKALAHMRGTTEYANCYIGAYLGWYDGSSKLRSLTGKTPTVNQTIGTVRTQAKANGTKYDQFAYYQMLMLQILYLVMFKSLDSQTALGKGFTAGGNSAATATGGKNTAGLNYGENAGTQQMKFCGVEDFYGNLRQWVDGLFCDASRNILMNNQAFNDTGAGYTSFGSGGAADIGGYMSGVQGSTDTGFIPKVVAGSTSTYYCDYGLLGAGYLPIFGGYWADGASAGAFYLNVIASVADANSRIGARLLALG
jgi:hypothetical protein